MRRVLGLTFVLAGLPLAAAAQAQPELHCYGLETQIGIAARRDFVDDRGQVVKQIFYRSADPAGRRECTDAALRVYNIKTITRDLLGRSVVETELSADGAVERVLRHEYEGDAKDASRDIWSAPDGTRRYEIRRTPRGRTTHLYYDEHGLVAGVTGPLPTDVTYALRWGTEVDGWSCGIAVANGSVNVHLKNGTQKETAVTFMDVFDTDLQSAASGAVPLLPSYRAGRASRPSGMSRLVPPREAAFYSYSLESRYGPLAPGHYSLAVWFPHPVSGVKMLSNRIEFDIAPGR